MIDYYLKLINERDHGLALIQVPTGYGKTYSTAEAIKRVLLQMKKDEMAPRKIIYITNLKKNLNEMTENLNKILPYNPSGQEVYVLQIKSNLDIIEDKILKTKLPDSFTLNKEYKTFNEKYETLKKMIIRYANMQKGPMINDAQYLEEFRKRVSDAEGEFRREISVILSKNFKTKEEQIAAIKNLQDYKWIGILYPTVFTDERQVLLTSVNKFMLKNSTIVEPSYDFLSAEFINGAIIFIDEFDASKKAMLDEIIKRANEMKNDYIALFQHIQRTLVKKNLSSDLHAAAEMSKGKYTLESIRAEGDMIEQTYHTQLSFKVEESDMDTGRNFLFKDGTFHSVLEKKNAYYIRMAENEEENRMSIYFETEKEYNKNHKDSDVVIFSMIREISKFLNHFKIFLRSWANNYCKIINENRHKKGIYKDEMTIDNALSSIMAKLYLNETQQGIIFNEICGNMVSGISDEIFPDISYYNTGVELFSFKDNDRHNDATMLEFIKTTDTPEKILLYLAQKALVFGISATAEIPTVTGNYNLKYLQEQLGDDYIPMDKELEARIAAELEEKYVAYNDGRITIHAEALPDKAIEDVESQCKKIIKDTELSYRAYNAIERFSKSSYYSQRYVNILKTMRDFIGNPDIQSMLYIGSALPKDGGDTMARELFNTLASISQKDAINNGETTDTSPFLEVLTANNFEEEKERVLERLSRGEKVYIMSAYDTIGAGQNLQYGFADKRKYVELIPDPGNGDKRHQKKDIDAIYLDDVTGKIINTNGPTPISEKERLELLLQIEDLHSNYELSSDDKDLAIKNAISAAHQGKANILSNKRSVKMRGLQKVLQAVGRICRTHIKSPHIYIYINEKLLDTLDTAEMCSRILPPEMRAIVELQEKLGRVYTPDEEQILNKAEKISSDNNRLIKRTLARGWNEMSMKAWDEWRNVALKHPTASVEEHDESKTIRNSYINLGEQTNSYVYSQFSDFSDITIHLDEDKIAFINSDRRKLKGHLDNLRPMTVSEEDSKLNIILKYPGMNAYFEKMGYATSFDKNDYIMCPIMFHNIYKGAIGEVAGKFILEAERKIQLTPITDPSKFEVFDFELAPNVYVDFKNWKLSFNPNREQLMKKISDKLDAIGGKRAYIINVIADPNMKSSTSLDGRIVEIPALIDENGCIISGALDAIKEEDLL